MKKYFLLLPLLLALGACSDEISVPEPDFPIDDPDWELNTTCNFSLDELETASALETFNYNFLKEVAASNPTCDFCCSPLSAELYLSALANGASGNTRNQMLKTLNVDDLEAINALNEKIMHCLPNDNRGSCVKISNIFWVADHYVINPEFSSTVKTVFNGIVESVDFGNPATVPTINKWVSRRSKGLIEKILPGSWKEYATLPMVSTNAIYFSGDWGTVFKPENTRTELFHAPGGDIKVNMMNMTYLTNYASHEKFQYVCKSFAGSYNHIELFLPADGVSLNELMDLLTPEVLDNLRPSTYHVTLSLPAFKVENRISMPEIINNMGINVDALDLSAMGLGTVSVITNQSTSMKLNEQGVEFAVAYETPIGTAPIGPQPVYPSVTVKFDRPFIYHIRPANYNERPGVIMLAGAVVNPRI
ncbi:MAG: hypothetical protein K2O00_01475 [Muribaculaceae bacterium]|nr:hypothetical protein [Muribaculaceae bacterium]